MAAIRSPSPTQSAAVVRAVTVMIGVVVGLTFLFGFGNVLNLALQLKVPVWVAPLIAPAVDLSILALLLGTRHLALTGAPVETLRPARRLLIFASVVTLALNVAAPLATGGYGRAAFDAVGPLLLIGWAEVGPGLLQSITATHLRDIGVAACCTEKQDANTDEPTKVPDQFKKREEPYRTSAGQRTIDGHPSAGLLLQARQEDAAHRTAHQKPISADKLRVRLGIGAAPARQLVKIVRAEFQTNYAVDRPVRAPEQR